MPSINEKQNGFYAGIGLAMITVVIWSGNYVVARGIAKELPPVSLAFYRWTLASICIFPFAIKGFKQQKQIIAGNKAYIFWTAVTGVALFNTLIYLAGHYTSAINLALIGTTSAPVMATFMAAVFLNERIGKYRIAGIAICIIGILYLISQGSLQTLLQFHFGKGDLMVLLSAFFFAIYNTLVRKKPQGLSPLVFLLTIFTLGSILLLPFYIFEVIHTPVVVWNASMIVIIIYLSIGNSIVAFFCWNASIEKLGASGTALFGNLIPVFSTIEAVIFLGEKFSGIHIISGFLVIGGLVIANIAANVPKPVESNQA